MFTLTPKENYLRAIRGEMPEWVPMHTFGKMPGDVEEPPHIMITPPCLNEHREGAAETDIWGVPYVGSESAGGGKMPQTHDFILTDITKWRDVIKAPDIDAIDWEAEIATALERSGVDREQTAVSLNLHVGYFQNLMAFMGFTEGLLAFAEEPEETKALIEYLCDFYCAVGEIVMPILEPDMLIMMDDTAALRNPFISLDTYREFLLPAYRREAALANDRGLPIEFHNCGRCEDFLDDMISFGVKAWDPAQLVNDLDGIKRKYKGKLTIIGAFETEGRLLAPDCTDEEIRQAVRASFDRMAPGGGYIFSGIFMGPFDDPILQHKNQIMFDEVAKYGRAFYGNER